MFFSPVFQGSCPDLNAVRLGRWPAAKRFPIIHGFGRRLKGNDPTHVARHDLEQNLAVLIRYGFTVKPAPQISHVLEIIGLGSPFALLLFGLVASPPPDIGTVMEEENVGGRPPWEPTAKDRRQVNAMSAYGIPQAEIASVLGISEPTLRKHCAEELATGAAQANARMAEFLYTGVLGLDGREPFKDEKARLTGAMFWLKTRAGWKETSIHEHANANGDPLKLDVRSALLDAIDRIAAAAAAGEDNSGDPTGDS